MRLGFWHMIWALAGKAAEKLKLTGDYSENEDHDSSSQTEHDGLNHHPIFTSGLTFYMETLNSSFESLSGDFRLTNWKLILMGFQIVNVISKGTRRVGFQTPTAGNITQEMNSLSR